MWPAASVAALLPPSPPLVPLSSPLRGLLRCLLPPSCFLVRLAFVLASRCRLACVAPARGVWGPHARFLLSPRRGDRRTRSASQELSCFVPVPPPMVLDCAWAYWAHAASWPFEPRRARCFRSLPLRVSNKKSSAERGARRQEWEVSRRTQDESGALCEEGLDENQHVWGEAFGFLQA